MLIATTHSILSGAARKARQSHDAEPRSRYSLHCVSVFFTRSVGVLTLLLTASTFAAPPVVLSSLRPLQLIVEDIAQGSVDVQSLLSVNVSPHEYSLRFSDLRRLQSAALLVWLGPEFESYLAKPLLAMSPPVKSLALLKGEAPSESNRHSNLEAGVHSWLDPMQVVSMLPAIASALAEVNPAFKVQYAERVSQLSQRLLALDAEFATLYESKIGVGVVTGHGGLEVFLRRYGLRHTGGLAGQHHAAPSLKRIIALRSELELGNASCIATSLSDGNLDVGSIFPELSAPTVRLDLLGRNANSYIELLSNVGNALYGCLEPSR